MQALADKPVAASATRSWVLSNRLVSPQREGLSNQNTLYAFQQKLATKTIPIVIVRPFPSRARDFLFSPAPASAGSHNQ